MKIAYVGIDALYPALPALAEAGCEIGWVFSCETDNVTEFNLQVCDFARKRGIPLRLERICRQDVERLLDGGCEALICGGYYHRLPVDSRLRMVNIHPSLLPVGRGAWPLPVTILRGLRESGVSVHRVTEGFDEGPVLLQERIELGPREDLESLTAKLQALLPGLMRRLAADFDSLYSSARPQAGGEYWPCPSESDYVLTPDTPLQEADLVLRAFYGYECVYHGSGGRFGLIRGRAVAAGTGGLPILGGEIVAERIESL